MKITIPTLTAAVCALALSSAHADVSFGDYTVNNGLGGTSATTADYQWSGFSEETSPDGVSASTAGLASEWTQGIAPANESTSIIFRGTPGFEADPPDAQTTDFRKAADGGGIYNYFSQTAFSLISSAPVENLNSLIFQINLAAGLTGGMGGSSIDFVDGHAPTLTLQFDGATSPLSIAATYTKTLSSEAVELFPGAPTTLSTLAFQWDISTALADEGITDTITGYSIDWQTGYHSMMFGLDATESDKLVNYDVLGVPEPSTWSLMGAAALGLLVLRRKRARLAA